jgi:hypothetical protein
VQKIDRRVWVTAQRPEKTAQEPGCRTRGEDQYLVDQRDAAIRVAGEMGKPISPSRERNGVVLAQFHGKAGRSNTFRDFLLPIDHPAIYLPPEMTPSKRCIFRCGALATARWRGKS